MDRPTFAAFRLPFLIAALALATASCITPSEFDQKIPNDTGSADQTSTDGTTDVTSPDVEQDLAGDVDGDGVDDGTKADTAGDDLETLEETDTLGPEVEVVTCATNETDCGNVCVDLQTDSNNCGACGNKCLSNQGACEAGVCPCLDGMGDCDNDTATGCETALDTPDNCGTCGVIDGCGRNGVACTIASEGTGSCSTCRTGYLDLDNDLSHTPSNGCETGIVEVGTATLVLAGQIVASTVDEADVVAKIFVATVDGADTVHLYAIGFEPSTNKPTIDGELQTGEVIGGDSFVGLAAYSNFCVVTVGDKLIGYEYASGAFTKFASSTLSGAEGISAVHRPSTDRIGLAEFTVAGSTSIEWVSAMHVDDGADLGLSCTSVAQASNGLCTIATQPAPQVSPRVATGNTTQGDQWLTSIDSTNAVEFELAVSTFTFLGVASDTTDAAFVSVSDFLISGETLVAAKGNSILSFAYGFGVGVVTRGGYRTLDIGDPGTDLALLDAQRVAVATSGGAKVILLPTTGNLSFVSLTPTLTEAVAVSNNRLFVFAEEGLTTVYSLDLH